MIDPRLDPHMDPARFNDAMREYQAYVAGKTRPMDPYLDPQGTPSTFGDQMSAYIGSYGMDPQATAYQQLPFESWGALFPNYAGAGVYSGPVLNALAPKFATRGEAQQYLQNFMRADEGFQDPLWDYRLAQRIAGATGAANDPGWQQWFAQAEQDAVQRTEIERQRDQAGRTGVMDILKGAAFVAGAMTGFGAIGGESFLGALGLGGPSASGTSGATSAIGTAADLISKGIGTPRATQLFEPPVAAKEVVGTETLAPTAPTARAVQKRRGSSSRAVAMRSPNRRRVSGRASTILGDYLSEDYLG